MPQKRKNATQVWTRHRAPRQRRSRREHDAEQRIERRAADPCLNTEPAARDDGAQHRGNVRALRPERGATKNRKRNSILGSGMSVENHRYEHDRVAEQNGDHRLPPVHARFDETSGERVGRDHHAHPDPERGDVPGGPGAFLDGCRCEIRFHSRLFETSVWSSTKSR